MLFYSAMQNYALYKFTYSLTLAMLHYQW